MHGDSFTRLIGIAFSKMIEVKRKARLPEAHKPSVDFLATDARRLQTLKAQLAQFINSPVRAWG